MSFVDDRARKVRSYFEDIHEKVFAGDPAANPNLRVELVSSALAHDTPVLVVVTPWTLIGLAFPPDGKLPSTLRLGASHYTVTANEVEELGPYFSILLVPDVSGYSSQDEVMAVARPLAEKLHMALESSRIETTQVVDGDRRALFKAMRGTTAPATRLESPFGSPNGPASGTEG
ncbi:MAG: [NiFe]-hydrogenase assembly chaperone HybE [Acidimicrobiia bacterium]